jgi:hypothetical protein
MYYDSIGKNDILKINPGTVSHSVNCDMTGVKPSWCTLRGSWQTNHNSAKHPEVKTTHRNVGDNNQNIETFHIG